MSHQLHIPLVLVVCEPCYVAAYTSIRHGLTCLVQRADTRTILAAVPDLVMQLDSRGVVDVGLGSMYTCAYT